MLSPWHFSCLSLSRSLCCVNWPGIAFSLALYAACCFATISLTAVIFAPSSLAQVSVLKPACVRHRPAVCRACKLYTSAPQFISCFLVGKNIISYSLDALDLWWKGFFLEELGALLSILWKFRGKKMLPLLGILAWDMLAAAVGQIWS